MVAVVILALREMCTWYVMSPCICRKKQCITFFLNVNGFAVYEQKARPPRVQFLCYIDKGFAVCTKTVYKIKDPSAVSGVIAFLLPCRMPRRRSKARRLYMPVNLEIWYLSYVEKRKKMNNFYKAIAGFSLSFLRKMLFWFLCENPIFWFLKSCI